MNTIFSSGGQPWALKPLEPTQWPPLLLKTAPTSHPAKNPSPNYHSSILHKTDGLRVFHRLFLRHRLLAHSILPTPRTRLRTKCRHRILPLGNRSSLCPPSCASRNILYHRRRGRAYYRWRQEQSHERKLGLHPLERRTCNCQHGFRGVEMVLCLPD